MFHKYLIIRLGYGLDFGIIQIDEQDISAWLQRLFNEESSMNKIHDYGYTDKEIYSNVKQFGKCCKVIKTNDFIPTTDCTYTDFEGFYSKWLENSGI